MVARLILLWQYFAMVRGAVQEEMTSDRDRELEARDRHDRRVVWPTSSVQPLASVSFACMSFFVRMYAFDFEFVDIDPLPGKAESKCP